MATTTIKTLASQGYLFTSHKVDLTAAKGHGKDVKGLTFDEVKSRLSKTYSVVGIKGGVKLNNGNFSLVIDADAPGMFQQIQEFCPKLSTTLQVRGSKLGHLYVETDEVVPKFQINTPDGKRAVDILGEGGTAVFPPSPHRKTGNPYEIINDAPPVFISWAELKAALIELCSKNTLTWVGIYPNEKKPTENYESDPIITNIKNQISLFNLGLSPRLQSCPLPGHKEGDKHPSLSVSPDGQLFNCFSLHGGGDVFKWVMLLENCDFHQAKLILLRKYAHVGGAFPVKFAQNAQKPLGANSQALSPDCPKCPKCGKPHDGDKCPEPYTLKARAKSSLPDLEAYCYGKIPKNLLEPPKWLIPNVIPAGGKVIIAAAVANFKSTLALYLASRMASGQPIWDGAPIAPVKVWFIDEEDSWGHIAEMISILRAALPEEGKALLDENLIVSSGQGVCMDRVDWFAAKARELMPAVIFVDSFRKLATGNENESEMINDIDSGLLSPILNELGVSWVLVHHNSKRLPKDTRTADNIELVRGSGALGGIATTILMLEKMNEDSVAFYVAKNKWGRGSAKLLYLRRTETSLTFEGGAELQIGLAAGNKLAEQIVDWLLKEGITENITSSGIKAKFDNSGGTMDSAIALLKKQGRLVGTRKDGRSPFRFVMPSAPAQKEQMTLYNESTNRATSEVKKGRANPTGGSL